MLRALIEKRFGTQPEPTIEEPTDPFFRRVLGRGAVRDFLPDGIPDALFDVLLACALSASSKSDLQQVSVIEIASRNQREAVAALVPNFNWVLTAPRFLIFCGDARRVEEIAAHRGVELDNGNVEGFLNATVDAALAMQTFILAAEAAGLGSCPVSNLRYRGSELASLLHLPDRVFPIAGLAVGYPANAARIKPRLQMEFTRHRDIYEAGDLEGLDEYDRRTDKAPAWSVASAAHLDANKAASFAKYLKDHGFPFAG